MWCRRNARPFLRSRVLPLEHDLYVLSPGHTSLPKDVGRHNVSHIREPILYGDNLQGVDQCPDLAIDLALDL